jgi:hypothetical protein
LKVHAAHEEAQWQGIMTCILERELMWDARHEDNKLWGEHITNMITHTMKGVAQGHTGREKE